MYTLLGRATSGNVQKILWLLEEMGSDYEREDYGRQFGNTGGEYLKMNPTGKVPTLVDGQAVIWESHTIIRYLCAREGSSLMPEDKIILAKAETWMDWLLASLNSNYVEIFKETKKPLEERSSDLDSMGDALAAHLVLLDEHLTNNEWLSGSNMSIAEIALGPIVNRCLGFPITLPAFDNLHRWHGLISSRPAYQKVVVA